MVLDVTDGQPAAPPLLEVPAADAAIGSLVPASATAYQSFRG
ncbi:hypothetical protein ACQP00_20160 [Dactylosporangium sp. CS-047395]